MHISKLDYHSVAGKRQYTRENGRKMHKMTTSLCM